MLFRSYQFAFANESLGIESGDDNTTAVSKLNAFLENNPIQVVHDLATLTPFSVTGQSVSILQGQNNLFADSGDVDIEYKADIQLWVEKKLSEL